MQYHSIKHKRERRFVILLLSWCAIDLEAALSDGSLFELFYRSDIVFSKNFIRIPQSTSSTLIASSRVFAWTVVLKCFSFDTSLALILPWLWLSQSQRLAKLFLQALLFSLPSIFIAHCKPVLDLCFSKRPISTAFKKDKGDSRMVRKNAVSEIVWLSNNFICNTFAYSLNSFFNCSNATQIFFFFVSLIFWVNSITLACVSSFFYFNSFFIICICTTVAIQNDKKGAVRIKAYSTCYSTGNFVLEMLKRSDHKSK